MEQEKIICAAVRLEDGKIFFGHRHPHCLEAMNDQLSWLKTRKEIASLAKEQGFMTTKARFVDREEALQIALAADQVLNKEQIRGKSLYSEDLY